MNGSLSDPSIRYNRKSFAARPFPRPAFPRARLVTTTKVGRTSGLPVRASSGCLSVTASKTGGIATVRPEVCPTGRAVPLSPNPEGIESSSSGLRAASYPGLRSWSVFNPERVALRLRFFASLHLHELALFRGCPSSLPPRWGGPPVCRCGHPLDACPLRRAKPEVSLPSDRRSAPQIG